MSNNTSAININVDSSVKKEAKKIENGEIKSKGYHNIDELFEDLNKWIKPSMRFTTQRNSKNNIKSC